MSLMKEFMDFLYEYKVIGLAIAFIIGVAATALIKSLVDNILMPIIYVLYPRWCMADRNSYPRIDRDHLGQVPRRPDLLHHRGLRGIYHRQEGAEGRQGREEGRVNENHFVIFIRYTRIL